MTYFNTHKLFKYLYSVYARWIYWKKKDKFVKLSNLILQNGNYNVDCRVNICSEENSQFLNKIQFLCQKNGFW